VLLGYCERDTLALFEVHGSFRNDIFVVPLWKIFAHNARAAQGHRLGGRSLQAVLVRPALNPYA